MVASGVSQLSSEDGAEPSKGGTVSVIFCRSPVNTSISKILGLWLDAHFPVLFIIKKVSINTSFSIFLLACFPIVISDSDHFFS